MSGGEYDALDDEERWTITGAEPEIAQDEPPAALPKPVPKQEREQAHRYKPESLRGVDWPVCDECGGPPDDGQDDAEEQLQRVYECSACDGVGHLKVPTDGEHYNDTKAGSDARVVIYAKRYAIGVPLFDDCHSRDELREPMFLTPETEF